MFKKIIVYFLLVVLLISCFVITALADSVIISQPEDSIGLRNSGGYVTISASVSVEPGSIVNWELDTGSGWFMLQSSDTPVNSTVINPSYYISPNVDVIFVRAIVTSPSGTVVYSRIASIFVSPATFGNVVTSGLRYVIRWVGDITDSLLDADGSLHSLLPLMAIAIAVTLVIVIIKIIKIFCWGA